MIITLSGSCWFWMSGSEAPGPRRQGQGLLDCSIYIVQRFVDRDVKSMKY